MTLEEAILTLRTKDPKKKLFKIKGMGDLLECLAVLVHYVRNSREVHIHVVSKNKFRFEETRAAYFAYLTEFTKSEIGSNFTVKKLHEAAKASFLVPLLTQEYTWFADLVIMSHQSQSAKESMEKLISIADGSIVTTDMLQEHFRQTEKWIQEEYGF